MDISVDQIGGLKRCVGGRFTVEGLREGLRERVILSGLLVDV